MTAINPMQEKRQTARPNAVGALLILPERKMFQGSLGRSDASKDFHAATSLFVEQLASKTPAPKLTSDEFLSRLGRSDAMKDFAGITLGFSGKMK